MTRWLKAFIFSLFTGILLPAFLLCSAFYYQNKHNKNASDTNRDAVPFYITVQSGTGSNIMELEDYVVHVLAAEMPLEFETEALKAQAVAARTYAVKAFKSGGKHGDGSVCTDSACCQGFCEDLYLSGQPEYRHAVADTAGIVLVYEDELIHATYFSCSGGSTEDALAVWGTYYPYLSAKTSPDCNEEHFSEEKMFLSTDLEKQLNVVLPEDRSHWFSDWTYTAGGGVNTVTVGNRIFKGTQIRRLLGLRSTLFSVSISGSAIIFHTNGYGHRVGMSQYGADALAIQGKNYEEILKYYYSGINLVKISDI